MFIYVNFLCCDNSEIVTFKAQFHIFGVKVPLISIQPTRSAGILN